MRSGKKNNGLYQVCILVPAKKILLCCKTKEYPYNNPSKKPYTRGILRAYIIID
jgi:hypothetical protein